MKGIKIFLKKKKIKGKKRLQKDIKILLKKKKKKDINTIWNVKMPDYRYLTKNLKIKDFKEFKDFYF